MRTDLAHEMNTKPQGNYSTVFCGEAGELDADTEIAELVKALAPMLPPDANSFLIAGLGNANITPDSLGVRTAGKTLATAHFTANAELQEEVEQLGLRKTYVLSPGVMAQTGFETAQQLKLLTDGISPDCLIVIDSLACNSFERLCATIQVTDTGITPGSGVANNRTEISQKTFGIPVVAVGVPTVIDYLGKKTPSGEAFMVVPRNIDIVVNHFSRVIATALNRVLNPGLSASEIDSLLMYS